MAADPPVDCANCGSPLYGEHCYACGQPTKGLVRHFSSIIGDALDTLFNVDGRLLRTLPALLLKPGFLSREYFDGHRVRYVSPVRLFVFLCIATFFAAKLASASLDLGDGDRSFATIDGAPTISFNGTPWDAKTNPLVIDALPDAANRWLNAQIGHVPENWKRIREDPDLLRNAFYSALPTALFVLVPVFALVLKALYLLKKRLYMEHLVVALHGHAFVCVTLLALMALTGIESLLGAPAWMAAPLGWLEWALMLWVPVYLWLHLKRVYGQSVLMTTLKFGLLGLAELLLLSIVATGALLSALVWL